MNNDDNSNLEEPVAFEIRCDLFPCWLGAISEIEIDPDGDTPQEHAFFGEAVRHE